MNFFKELALRFVRVLLSPLILAVMLFKYARLAYLIQKRKIELRRENHDN